MNGRDMACRVVRFRDRANTKATAIVDHLARSYQTGASESRR